MKLARFAFRSINNGISNPFHRSSITTRTFSVNAFSDEGIGNNQNNKKSESADEFERRIFGGGVSDNSDYGSFFRKLDRLERGRNRVGLGGVNGPSMLDRDEGSDADDERFDTLSDGMDGKLKNAAMYFKFDTEEVEQDGYTFRPDANFPLGSTYDIKDLDLRKPGVRKPLKRREFEVTTDEVLKKADFRNVRFLANFLTDAGIIIKRSKTGISAKAQRKVAREIKTARAFGLMPFTTMGTKSFIYGNTMEALDADFEYESYDSPMTAGADGRGPF
ncbi:hypothetical protein ACOSP7_025130 [Xanthoceras sorbifolium]|uniref:Small ribosomal subunit protein bS18c n=1 Tax=Xanthoceras sorbifolium TaxID=99658 RepID=A0ABQ8H7J4_9ROSI|nr:hypothetical protein JRO89_XS13G0098700 [Xanthoceras sorbifolium]